MLTSDELNDLRKKVLANEALDYAKVAEAVKQLIHERLTAFEKPAKAKTKGTPIALDDLL